MNRNEYINDLKNNICCVVFTKANGKERVLYGTLNSLFLPNKKDTEQKSSKEVNEDIVTIFDLETFQFKSFRVDSVKYFEILGFECLLEKSSNKKLEKISLIFR